MSAFSYLLDENIDPRLRDAILRVSPDATVWIVGDPGAPDRGASDPEVLIWCEQNDFALVTNNRASMSVHLQGHADAGGHVPGIFILNPDASMAETRDELLLIWMAAERDEFQNQIVYLPL